MRFGQTGSIGGKHGFHRGKSFCGEHESDETAEARKHDALREELCQDASATSAESGAHSDFLFACGRAGESQVRHIGAGDQNDQSYGSEKHQQAQADVRDHAASQRKHADAGVPVLGHDPGKQGADARLKHANFGASLLVGNSRVKPADHGHEIVRPIQNRVSRIVVQRNPDLRFCRREAEVGWHYADNLAADAFQLNRAADDCGVAGEALLPERMTEDDVIILAGNVLTGNKRTA